MITLKAVGISLGAMLLGVGLIEIGRIMGLLAYIWIFS